MDGAPKLTNQGYALAADIGLLIARFLFEEVGASIRWEILRKPRTDISFNLPVITGFYTHFGPVGGMIAESYGILRGNKSGKILRQTFEFWKNKTHTVPSS
jgi:hypothetical protein